jgi:hypothetical protein
MIKAMLKPIKLSCSVLFISILNSFVTTLNGQSTTTVTGSNIVQTAVPFLTINPDSRAAGMGDAGAATSPDINSMNFNPAKFAFMDRTAGASLSYSPWLSQLQANIQLLYLSGYKKIGDRNTVAASLRYFALGDIQFTDDSGNSLGSRNPNEFAIDAALARKFSENISGSVAFRFIRSDLTNGQTVSNVETHAGTSFASDISVYYNKKITMAEKPGKLSIGGDISNIGTKISYSSSDNKEFIPTNLRIGGALESDVDEYNSFTFALDLNKLLVPTPDSTANVLTGTGFSNIGPVAGIFRSFSDAPGGFKEEMHEINYSVGAEYWYQKQFAIRAGYFYEYPDKGNRKYFTVGIGLKLNVFTGDFSYLIPIASNSPLARTVRFSLSFDLDRSAKTPNSKTN